MELMKNHEGDVPDRFPSNFIEEWGKRDLRAAEDWVAKNPELPFNEWSGLYEAAQESLGTKAPHMSCLEVVPLSITKRSKSLTAVAAAMTTATKSPTFV